MLTMNSTARYSLLAMRPDPERIDLLCVGALVLAQDGSWSVLVPGATKLEALGYVDASRRLMAMAANLRQLLDAVGSLSDARLLLANMRSALSVDTFEGVFSFDSLPDFQAHLTAITSESISMPEAQELDRPVREKPARALVRTRLRRHFHNMGILASSGDKNADHRVVPNYLLSAKHGLKAEFALKNSVWHITETVDFDVASESVRNKTFEAQAKCLVLRAAKEILGPKTQRYIVVHGSESAHAANSVDLLSTAGKLVMTENDDDMTTYLNTIAHAAKSTPQLR